LFHHWKSKESKKEKTTVRPNGLEKKLAYHHRETAKSEAKADHRCWLNHRCQKHSRMKMQTKPSTVEAKPVYTAEKAGATRRQTRFKRDKSHQINTSVKSKLISFILSERW